MIGKLGPEDAKCCYHHGQGDPTGQLGLCLMQASSLLCLDMSSSFKSPFNHLPELTEMLGKAESKM